ncbi:hypothetical protein GCM10027590_47210 [Nocardiopsis nanhaiensis]
MRLVSEHLLRQDGARIAVGEPPDPGQRRWREATEQQLGPAAPYRRRADGPTDLPRRLTGPDAFEPGQLFVEALAPTARISAPTAAKSSTISPTPSPRDRRPPERASMVAARLARVAVVRVGPAITTDIRRTRIVTAAAAARVARLS